jgi:hypothetical protein
MPCVIYKPLMLSVVMLSVVILSVLAAIFQHKKSFISFGHEKVLAEIPI